MKRTISIVFTLFFMFFEKGIAAPILQNIYNIYGNTADQVILSVTADNSNNIYFSGYNGNVASRANLPVIGKVDGNGNVVWTKQIESSAFGGGYFSYIYTTNDGNLIAGGVLGSGGSQDVRFTVKVNATTGNVIWVKSYDESSVTNNDGNSFHKSLNDPDGETYYNSYLTGDGERDVIVVKLSANGQIIWKNKYNAGNSEESWSSTVGKNGALYVVGQLGSNPYAFKIDKNGNVLKSKQLTGINGGFLGKGVELSNGQLAIGGYINESFGNRAFIALLDTNLNLVNCKKDITGSNVNQGGDLQTDISGNIYFSALEYNLSTSSYKTIIYKFTSSLGFQWSKNFAGNGETIGPRDNSVIVNLNTSPERLFIGGFLNSANGFGAKDGMIALLDTSFISCVTTQRNTTFQTITSTTTTLNIAKTSVVMDTIETITISNLSYSKTEVCCFNKVTLDTITIQSGQSATIFGIPRTVEGLYSQTKTIGNGCDSLLQIYLKVLVNNSSIVLTPLSPTTICATGNDTLVYSVNASNIPTNTNVVIYQSTDSTFNPAIGQGDSIGFIKGDTTSSSIITSTCPKILGIFIDACNDSGRLEPANEYMVITSGQGFRVANLKVDVPNTSLRDINTGNNPCSFGTPSATLMNSLRTGFCNSTNLLSATQSDSIPPNAIVIIFTGAGTDYPYNLSRFCQTGQKIYILQNSCIYGSGAFVNNDASPSTCSGATATTRYRTTSITNRSCFDELTYDRCGLNEFDGANQNANDGNYVIRLNSTDTSSVANGGIQNNAADRCNGVVLDSIIKSQTLKFAIPTAFCNTGFHYIKAVLKPFTTPSTVSNTIQYQYVCNDVRAVSNTTNICSGQNALVNISSTDPNATFSWTVSGGANITGASAGTGNIINQQLTYTGLTNENLTYNITSNDAGCTKTTSVNVTVRNCAAAIDTVFVCQGDSVRLNGPNGYEIYNWNPTDGLNNPTIQNPNASPDHSMLYVVDVYSPSNELIVNGNFQQGNTGFNSEYQYTTSNNTEGQYFIGTNASLWNAGMTACGDHSTGSTNMMFANGAPIADKKVWCQTVNVAANTDYAFSTWLTTLTPGNLALLQFSINDVVLQQPFQAPTAPCNWQNFYTIWNSGINTSANICIVNKNTVTGANDFALDDISFRSVTLKDSVYVVVVPPPTPTISGNTSICNGNSTVLTANGQFDSVRWSTNETTISINANQVGNYSVIAYKNGCSGTANVNVTGTIVSVNITGGNVICGGTSVALTANGQFDSLRWNTNATTTSINATQQGTYTVTAYKGGCFGTATFNVARVSIDYFLDKKSAVICNGDTATFILSAGDLGVTAVDTFYFTQEGRFLISYQTPSCGLFTDSVVVVKETPPTAFSLGNDTAFCGDFVKVLSTGNQTTVWSTGVTAAQISVTQAGQYIATISNACGLVSDTIIITQNPSPNVALGNDTAFCDGEITLAVNAGLDVRNILWSTGAQSSSITISSIGTYAVKVTNTSGCSDSDAINITSNCANQIWLPNAFTPEGNGINDVFYVRGNPNNTVIERFVIFNRWGNKVFEANNILPDDKTKGWNGTYRNQSEQLEVYGYEVIAKFANGEKRTLKGNVTLLK